MHVSRNVINITYQITAICMFDHQHLPDDQKNHLT